MVLAFVRKCALTQVLLCGTVLSAAAQVDSATTFLDSVAITASREKQIVLNTPYSVALVTRRELDQYQYRTTPEALNGLNGVFVQKTNHGGGSPYLRGLIGNQTLLLVDGIRLNNSTFRYGPNQYLNTVDPFTIERIEVAKGTGSVQYGSDALGGVLQVLTRDPHFAAKRNWFGSAAGRFTSGDMQKTARAEGGYTAEKTALLFGGTYKDFGDLIGGDTTGRQTPSGYDEVSFDAKAKFLLQPGAELTIAHQFLQQRGVPVYHKVLLENFGVNEMGLQQRMLHYARLRLTNAARIFQGIEMTASWQRSRETRRSQKRGSALFKDEEDGVNTLGFATEISSLIANAWTASSGVELYADHVRSSTFNTNTQTGVKQWGRGLYPDDARYVNYALYSLHHLTFGKLRLEAGVRYNRFFIRIPDTTLGEVRLQPSAFVYNAALLYKLTAQQSIFAAFNTGYRAPNIDDMGTLGIVDFRYEVPAKNLLPEKTRTIEVGYKLGSRKWAASVSAYYMFLYDLITRVKVEGQVISGYSVYLKENVESAHIKGVEAALSFQPVRGLELSGAAAFTHGQSISKKEPLRRIPPFNGRLRSSYHFKTFFASAELLFASLQNRLAQGDKDDNRIPPGGTPGFNIFNLYGGLQIQRLRLNVGLQNLFNDDYRTHGSGINGVGRSVTATASLAF